MATARVMISLVVTLVTACAGGCREMPNDVSPRVFASLVEPADYPDSPHAWPAGEPITIECWGNETTRQHSRDAVRATRALDSRDSAVDKARLIREAAVSRYLYFLSANSHPSELATVETAMDLAEADYERLQAELDDFRDLTLENSSARFPALAITLRTGNGTRYGWRPDRRNRPDMPSFQNVDDIFPPGRLELLVPSMKMLNESRHEYEQALASRDVEENIRAWQTLEFAEAAVANELEAWERRNALSRAISRDALEACAR